MAFSVDATSYGNNGAGGTSSITLSHTCASGASILVVCLAANSSTDIFTGVTYNGVAMTRAIESDVRKAGAIYYLVNPDSGTHNIVASISSSDGFGVGGISLTGAGAIIGNSGHNDGSGGTVNITSATTGTAGGIIIALCVAHDPATFAFSGTGTSWQTGLNANGCGFSFVYENFTASNNPVETWTQSSGARTWETMYLEIDLGAVTQTATVTAKARIFQPNNTVTVTAKARTKVSGNDKTITAKGRVKATSTQTIGALAKIGLSPSQTIDAKARIFETVTATATAKADIAQLDNTVTATAKAKVNVVQGQTIQAMARVFAVNTATLTAKAKIAIVATTVTITAKTRVLQAGIVGTISAMARIASLKTITVTAKAKIWAAHLRLKLGVRQKVATGERYVKHG